MQALVWLRAPGDIAFAGGAPTLAVFAAGRPIGRTRREKTPAGIVVQPAE